MQLMKCFPCITSLKNVKRLSMIFTVSFYLDIWSLYHVWLVNINFSLGLISLQCTVKSCKSIIISWHFQSNRGYVDIWRVLLYLNYVGNHSTLSTLKRHRKHIRRIFFTFVGHSNIFKYCKRIFFRDYFISRFNF